MLTPEDTKEKFYDAKTTAGGAESVPPSQPVYGSYGWVCPVCGRGNGPMCQTCPCMPLPPMEVTC